MYGMDRVCIGIYAKCNRWDQVLTQKGFHLMKSTTSLQTPSLNLLSHGTWMEGAQNELFP